MAYLHGTPIRAMKPGRKVTTVHVDEDNYKHLMTILKEERYNFSHFMDSLLSVLTAKPELIHLIIREGVTNE